MDSYALRRASIASFVEPCSQAEKPACKGPAGCWTPSATATTSGSPTAAANCSTKARAAAMSP